MHDCPSIAGPESVVLLFLDGVGVGSGDPDRDPFTRVERIPNVTAVLAGRSVPGYPQRESAVAHADATLGVPGLPQSGTGQVALLSGVNAPREFGRHFGSWVPTPLREAFARGNLLSDAVRAGCPSAFANAYPIHRFGARSFVDRRPAAFPFAAHAAGLLVRDAAEIRAGQALVSSITTDAWRDELRADVPEVDAREGGRILARIAAAHRLTVFAHYDTDAAGHAGGMDAALGALRRVDSFLGGLLELLPASCLLVTASDHGNLEDVSVGHTRNPVPVAFAGPGARALAARVGSITDLAPLLLEVLRIDGATAGVKGAHG